MTDAGAIVVLGGGKLRLQPEYENRPRPSGSSYARLAYALELQKRYEIPILVTGGAAQDLAQSEAVAMATALNEFGAGQVWAEPRSSNTWENAVLGAELLDRRQIHKVLLVTDSMHVSRAAYAFEKQGLEVVPAPTTFARPAEDWYGIWGVVPQQGALEQSTTALKRIVGELVYRLRYR